jgi:short-subunit dehydrogenase
MQRDLTGKVIAITGGSSGIGAATAQACAAAGMDVALSARRRDRLEAVAELVRQQGREAVVVPGDVTDAQAQQQFFEQAWQTLGRVDVIFANAGYGIFGSVLDTPEADHRAIFETNYFATLTTLKTGVPYLRRTENGLSHVLICSSAASEIALPMFGAYAATKAAQDAIAGAMRAELAETGIVVTSVHPVGTRTEFFDTARQRSPQTDAGQPGGANTPEMFTQSVDHVAKRIVAALRRPKAEVWPMRSARWSLALATALPGLTAWLLRQQHKKVLRQASGG